MTLYDMLDKGMCYSTVWIYKTHICRNDKCDMIFEGDCADARGDSAVWDYLLHDVDSYICGDNGILIYLITDEAFDSHSETSTNVEMRFTRETSRIK